MMSPALLVRMLKGSGWVLIVLFSVSCSDLRSKAVVSHPRAEFMVHPIEPRGVIRLDAPESRSPQAVRLLEGWESLEASEVGSVDGHGASEHSLFGEVRSALTSPSGRRVILLDGMAREIRVFDRFGDLSERVAGRGGGPGNLLRPRALRLGTAGYLLAFEAMGRVSFFELTGDSITYSHRIELRIEIEDACVLGGHLYIHGRRVDEPEVIHVFDMEGRGVASFGVAYSSGNPMVRFQLSRGRIACLEATGVVLFAPAHLPEVRAYGPAGDLRWWWSIEGFRNIGFEEMQRSQGTRMWSPDHGFHATTGLVASLSGDAVALQVTEVLARLGEHHRPSSVVHTFVLTGSGEAADYLGDGLGVMHEWDESRIMVSGLDEFPSLRIAF